MKKYRIYCLDSTGRICLAHVVECRDDIEAAAEGEKVCGEYGAEVWDEGRLVSSIKIQGRAAQP